PRCGVGPVAEYRSAPSRRRAAVDARHGFHRGAPTAQARLSREPASPPLRCSTRGGGTRVPAIDGPSRGWHPRSADNAGALSCRRRWGRAEHLRPAVEMSRLYEALAAMEQRAKVLARTDFPSLQSEGWARRRRWVIALCAVGVLGAAGLTVTICAPLVPSPTAPLVSPLPSVPPPEPLRASELRDRAREVTVLGSLAGAEELLQRAV